MMEIRGLLSIIKVVFILLLESLECVMMASLISVVFRGPMVLETLLTKPRWDGRLMLVNNIRPDQQLLLLNNLLLYMLITLITYLLMLLLNHPCQRMMA